MLDDKERKVVIVALTEYREQMKSWKQTGKVLSKVAQIEAVLSKLKVKGR